MPQGILSGTAVALAFCAAVTLAGAQSSSTMHRVGWLGHGNPPPARTQATIGDFLLAMRDAGYVEGRNLTVEYRYANGSVDRLPELVAELVRLKVDVIVTSGEPAALAAKRVTTSIPIVVTEIALDPVKAGLVASLGRPEGNVTGLTSISDELWHKRLELLKALVPKLARMVVFANPANTGNVHCVDEVRAAAKAIDVQVRMLEVSSKPSLERAFADVERTPSDALVTCWDSMTLEHARSIGDFALARRLPTLAPLREYVEAGALVSFGANLPAERRRAAHYVARILKGSKPASLPVERPTHFELVVNARTAAALGLALPPPLMVMADDLIQ